MEHFVEPCILLSDIGGLARKVFINCVREAILNRWIMANIIEDNTKIKKEKSGYDKGRAKTNDSGKNDRQLTF